MGIGSKIAAIASKKVKAVPKAPAPKKATKSKTKPKAKVVKDQ